MFGSSQEQTIITHNHGSYLEVLRTHAMRIVTEHEQGNPPRQSGEVLDLEQQTRALISQLVREVGYDYDFSEIARVGVFLGNGMSWIQFATYRDGRYNADFKLKLQKKC